MMYVSEMTEGQTLCHAGSCDKAEDCRSGIGMTPDRHLPVTPKSKNVPIMEWIYSFIDWTKATTGKNYCPLFYLIADEGDRDKTSPEDAPFLIPGHHFGGD